MLWCSFPILTERISIQLVFYVFFVFLFGWLVESSNITQIGRPYRCFQWWCPFCRDELTTTITCVTCAQNMLASFFLCCLSCFFSAVVLFLIKSPFITCSLSLKCLINRKAVLLWMVRGMVVVLSVDICFHL